MSIDLRFPYCHESYAEVLNGFHADCLAQRKSWTLGVWARQLGLSSTASLTNILKGRKIPSESLHEKISSSVSLKSSDRKFVDLMLEQARLEGAKRDTAAVRKRIEALRKRSKITKLKLEDFQIIASPLAHALIEVTRIDKPIHSVEDLVRRFPGLGSLPKVSMTWDQLLEARWIEKDELAPSGFRAKSQSFDLPSIYRSELIRMFHEEQTLSALHAIRELPAEQRSFGSIVLGVDAADVAELEKDLDAMRMQLIAKYGSSTTGRIIQINLQAFPFRALF